MRSAEAKLTYSYRLFDELDDRLSALKVLKWKAHRLLNNPDIPAHLAIAAAAKLTYDRWLQLYKKGEGKSERSCGSWFCSPPPSDASREQSALGTLMGKLTRLDPYLELDGNLHIGHITRAPILAAASQLFAGFSRYQSNHKSILSSTKASRALDFIDVLKRLYPEPNNQASMDYAIKINEIGTSTWLASHRRLITKEDLAKMPSIMASKMNLRLINQTLNLQRLNTGTIPLASHLLGGNDLMLISQLHPVYLIGAHRETLNRLPAGELTTSLVDALNQYVSDHGVSDISKTLSTLPGTQHLLSLLPKPALCLGRP